MIVVRMIKHTDNICRLHGIFKERLNVNISYPFIFFFIIAWNINNAFLFIYLSLFYIFSATMKNYEWTICHVFIEILARFCARDLWRLTKQYWLSIKFSVKRPASKPENRNLEEANRPGEGERTGDGGSILTHGK